MTMNRTARRALKARAPAMARLWSLTCLDISEDRLQPINAPAAVEALRKAFQRMIEAGCRPMAFPISEAAAMGFPVRNADPMPGAAHILAVGVDVLGCGTCTLESVLSDDPALAHEMGRQRALARLRKVCAVAGYTATAD
jgi:hypothetical protein